MRVPIKEYEERKRTVLGTLAHVPVATINEATKALDISYSQKIHLLQRMEEDGTVIRVGKNGANILYKRSVPRSVTDHTFSHLGQSLKVIGAHLDGFDMAWELEAPNGSVVTVKVLEPAA